MYQLAKTLLLLFTFATPATAGFVDNKAQWDEIPSHQKESYIVGAYDGLIGRHSTDTNKVLEWKEHIYLCVLKQKMTGLDLLELVETMYRNDVSTWTKKPPVLLAWGLQKMCGSP